MPLGLAGITSRALVLLEAGSVQRRALAANRMASAPWMSMTAKYAQRQLAPVLTMAVTASGDVAAPIP
jgi:hypothetical protein